MKEVLLINKEIVILTEIPKGKVIISGLDSHWEEVHGEVNKKYQYRVDYNDGVIHFHKKLNGEEVSVEYEGKEYVFKFKEELDKDKLTMHLASMQQYYQEEANKFAKGGIVRSANHYQAIADTHFKLLNQVLDGKFDYKGGMEIWTSKRN